LRIAAFQSVLKTKSVEGGGVIGSRYGGNVTASFPEGIVVLRTSSDRSKGELTQFIKEKVTFRYSKIVKMNPFFRHELKFSTASKQPNRFEFNDKIFKRGLIVGEYWASITPIVYINQSIILDFRMEEYRFDSNIQRILSDRFKNEIAHQVLTVNHGETLLIGFVQPLVESRHKGNVYWIAITQRIQ
jgi:hypothetical protein